MKQVVDELKSLLEDADLTIPVNIYGRCPGCNSNHPYEYHHWIDGKQCWSILEYRNRTNWKARVKAIIEQLDK